jgi:hypothetical protein
MAWELLGKGCDKRFYVEDAGNGGYGAICCDKPAVVAREMKAYIDLKTLGLSVLPTILPWTDPNGITVDGKTEKPAYQIQRLMIGKTFKPIMCTMQVLNPVKNEIKRGNTKSMKAGLQEIDTNLEAICNIVGELTLAIDAKSGGVFMLDFSPAENGNRAIGQLESIKKGMQNLLAAVG